MTAPPGRRATGWAGRHYPITQVSVAVHDLEQTMELYWRAFGWSGWNVFSHVAPSHHNTELRGKENHFTLKSAEVTVGAVNFRLVEPLEGPSVWKQFIADRGEGLASIAVMFKTREDSDAVKREFAERGIPVSMRANIGEDIEYYVLDTHQRFGCLIESGSGHASDFAEPAYVYPTDDAPPTERAPGLEYRISAIPVVVRDLEARMRAYHDAFGWGPWEIFEADGDTVMHDCELDGEPVDYFNIRWAETKVGDLTFELVEPRGGDTPWQRMLDEKGEGISCIGVMFGTRSESEKVLAQFHTMGIERTVVGHIGDHIEWYYLDTQPGFKCNIESGSGHAVDFMKPVAVYPSPTGD